MLRYPTQEWYYLAVLAFTAVGIEAILSIVSTGAGFRIFRLLATVLIAGMAFSPALDNARRHFTNAGMAVQQLEKEISPNDYVLIDPWYCGVSFHRYYSGRAQWETVPPISFRAYHRYDLLKAQMMATNQVGVMEPVFAQMEAALKSGRRVWRIGGSFPPDREPAVLPPAPQSPFGWADYPYMSQWCDMAASCLRRHATKSEDIPIPPDNNIDGREEVSAMVFSGWKD
jgi:hypothetical protein